MRPFPNPLVKKRKHQRRMKKRNDDDFFFNSANEFPEPDCLIGYFFLLYRGRVFFYCVCLIEFRISVRRRIAYRSWTTAFTGDFRVAGENAATGSLVGHCRLDCGSVLLFFYLFIYLFLFRFSSLFLHITQSVPRLSPSTVVFWSAPPHSISLGNVLTVCQVIRYIKESMNISSLAMHYS